MRTLALLACLLPAPVLALSCIPPDPVLLYTAARDSDDVFAIFRGRIADPIPLESVGTGERWTVRLDGAALGTRTFDTPVDRIATLEVTCISDWCGSLPKEDATVIASVRVTQQGLSLEADACGFSIVPDTREGIDRLLTCHRSGVCSLAN